MKEELKKSLTDLIDETLLELEELKKSRFSAAEIEIKGPGAESLAGKPVNGKLDASKAEEDKEDEEKKEDAEKSDVEKADGINVEKAEDKKDEPEKKDEDKKDEPEKKDEEKKDEVPAFVKKSAEELETLKKSVGDMETLMKSYVDEKLAPVQTQLASILEAVQKLADAPVPAKGVSYKGVAPLAKSDERAEPLSKSEVASKLFELKKSGTRVDSTDIARAEMGHDLEKIITKYNIQ